MCSVLQESFLLLAKRSVVVVVVANDDVLVLFLFFVFFFFHAFHVQWRRIEVRLHRAYDRITLRANSYGDHGHADAHVERGETGAVGRRRRFLSRKVPSQTREALRRTEFSFRGVSGGFAGTRGGFGAGLGRSFGTRFGARLGPRLCRRLRARFRASGGVRKSAHVHRVV